jgi:hypothetical protein
MHLPAPLHPSAQRYHFLNGAITGNVGFREHFTVTPSKQRRMKKSDNTKE